MAPLLGSLCCEIVSPAPRTGEGFPARNVSAPCLCSALLEADENPKDGVISLPVWEGSILSLLENEIICLEISPSAEPYLVFIDVFNFY